MRQASRTLSVETRGKGLFEITSAVRQWVRDQQIPTGLLTVFCRHTSASLLIQENADPDVRADLLTFFEEIAPQDPSRYLHDDEGPDDMPAHIRTALTQVQLTIPIVDAAPALGTWQGVYVFEHRSRPHTRQIVLHILGE